MSKLKHVLSLNRAGRNSKDVEAVKAHLTNFNFGNRTIRISGIEDLDKAEIINQINLVGEYLHENEIVQIDTGRLRAINSKG